MRILPTSLFSFAAMALLTISLNALNSKINLAGRKDVVMQVEKRETVLDVGEAILSNQNQETLPDFGGLPDPFTFEVAPPPESEENAKTEKKAAEPEPVVYEDAEVLALSAASFAKKVRGSIVRGDSSFLQLEGGALLKPGTSFPVRLPQARDQVFTLTVSEITSEGYTLQVGEVSQQFNFNSRARPDSIKFTNP